MAACNVAEDGSLRIPGDTRRLTAEVRSTSLGSRLNLYMGVGKSLTAVEERFLMAAELGDIETVRHMLKNLQIGVDFADALGRTPIRLAVGNDHVEVVELLLKHSNNTSIREALLQAINNGNDQIAEFILRYLNDRDDTKTKQKFGDDDYFYMAQEESQFSADTTPLILAARKNRFHVVLILLRSGELIAKPHNCYCSCVNCCNKRQFDELRLAKTRLNAYRGLASEAYISLSSKDPILEAFQLGKELRVIAEIDKCYKTDYLILAEDLSEYVVKLLDKVRGHDELEKVLNKVGTDLDEEEESFELLERFKLAIDYGEKKFVAHPACQQTLIRIWYSKVHFLERANLTKKILIGIAIMLCFPPMAVSFWFAPRSKVGSLLRSPCVKFMGRLLSLLIFMVMIVISSITKHKVTKLTDIVEIEEASTGYLYAECSAEKLCGKSFVIRQSKAQVIDILLAFWIMGMLWQEVKQFYQNGLWGYFSSLFNYLDTATLVLYLNFIMLKLTCLWKVNKALDYFSHKQSWESFHNKTEEAKVHMYWLISDRTFWEDHDPENLAEAAFAIANIITFTRICYIFPAHELFGPLQISLVRMAKDILTFVAIFVVLFLAFMVGLHNLYWYYPLSTRRNFQLYDHNLTDVNAEEHFGILDLTFRTVFWASLGQSDSAAVQLGGFRNFFTENVGYWIFGAYSVACVIVLINMLIAMMTRSFDSIQSEAHTEWKFARSMLYMEYIKEDCTLPVPFNVVPSPKFLWNTLRAVYDMLLKAIKKEPVQIYHPGRIPDVELFPSQSNETNFSSEGPPIVTASRGPSTFIPGIESFRKQRQTALQRNDTEPDMFRERLTYKRVMNRIIRRYMFDKHLAECAEDEAKENVNFRFELQSALSEYQKELDAKFQDHGNQIKELTRAFHDMQGDDELSDGSTAHCTPKRVKLDSEHSVIVHIDDV